MHSVLDALHLLAFIELGGPIILVLFVLCCLLWCLILQRLFFLLKTYPEQMQEAVQQWHAREDKKSWAAQKIRALMLSEHGLRLQRFHGVIQVLIAICPLLGLLGTVSGMINVFDAIAITGSSDAKAMASGIYKATLPTMAGLVLALSGLYFRHFLQQKAQTFHHQLADQLLLTKATPPPDINPGGGLS